MRFAVVVFPGSNCDHDCYHVLKHVFGQEVGYVWHKETSLDGFDAVVLPGGFSYGDYLRTGAIARFSPVMESVIDFARRGAPVLGICNGYQILCEAGLLPGALMQNQHLKFVCKNAYLRVENNRTPYTHRYAQGEVLRIPVAHGDGLYYAGEDTLQHLNDERLVVFRYCDRDGNITPEANPNGSVENIAGIISPAGNILGIMPHPDRCSESILNSNDGARFFESMIESYAEKVVS